MSPTAPRSRRWWTRRPDVWAGRRHDQQRRADAALAARAAPDRRVGPDDRRESQGRPVRDRRGAALHEAAEIRALHQRLSVAGHKVGPGTAVYAATSTPCGPLRRAAPGGEALQHPHDGDLAGRGGPSGRQRDRPGRGREGPQVLRGPSNPRRSRARAVAFAISQPDDVDINEILFRPTRQEL